MGNLWIISGFASSFLDSSLPDALSDAPGAPLGGDGASPLRVATGGAANWSSKGRRRRSPVPAQRRREDTGSVQRIAGRP